MHVHASSSVGSSAFFSKLQVLKEQMQVDFIDINMGCPIDLVYKKGQGSALMNRLSKLEQVTTSLGLGYQIRGGAGADITNKYRPLSTEGACNSAFQGTSSFSAVLP